MGLILLRFGIENVASDNLSEHVEKGLNCLVQRLPILLRIT
jgi:hypothetical protein